MASVYIKFILKTIIKSMLNGLTVSILIINTWLFMWEHSFILRNLQINISVGYSEYWIIVFSLTQVYAFAYLAVSIAKYICAPKVSIDTSIPKAEQRRQDEEKERQKALESYQRIMERIKQKENNN